MQQDETEQAIQVDRRARYELELTICARYERSAQLLLALCVAVSAAGSFLSLPALSLWLLWLSAALLGTYLYFVNRYLENLGTRYDLLPIVRRSRLLDKWANRPILFFVPGLVLFLLAWLSALAL